jgi:N-acetylmuramoyl-L-alanine amidase
VLDVALRLRRLLERDTACEVVMTRSDDTFIPLEERTAIANEKGADLFLSIHANASRDQSARGIETYYLNFTSSSDALEVAARENSTSQESVHELQDLIKKIAMTEKIEESQDFAKQVQREVYARVMKASGAQRDRGVKKAPFVVLIGANMPSVLAEISFLSNPQDERLLRRAEHRQKIAVALLDGIEEYVKNMGGVRTVQRAMSKETSSFVRPEF